MKWATLLWHVIIDLVSNIELWYHFRRNSLIRFVLHSWLNALLALITRDKEAVILQKSLVCMKTGSFGFKFQWSSSYDVIYNKPAYAYWWLGAKQATFHYLWVYGGLDFTNICVTRHRWIKTGVKWKPHSSALLSHTFNTLRPRRNEQHFADDIFKRI